MTLVRHPLQFLTALMVLAMVVLLLLLLTLAMAMSSASATLPLLPLMAQTTKQGEML